MSTTLVKPKTCSRCKGKGYLPGHRVVYAGGPGGCFKCDGTGVVESDQATIAARKALTAQVSEAARIAYAAGHDVWVGWSRLEVDDPARFAKAVASILAGHPRALEALAAYGKEAA